MEPNFILKDKMFIMAIIISSILFVVMVIILVFCFIRNRKKKVMRLEYSEDSDREPFVEAPICDRREDGCDVHSEEETDIIERDATMTSIVSFEDQNGHLPPPSASNHQGCLPPTALAPFQRHKSYTVSGCSPKLLARENFKRKQRSISEDCNQNEMSARDVEALTTENSIFDSFSKMKNIYDYQSSRCSEPQLTSPITDAYETTIVGAEDTGYTQPSNPEFVPLQVGVQHPDDGFDRVKDLYDKCNKIMTTRQQSISEEPPPDGYRHTLELVATS